MTDDPDELAALDPLVLIFAAAVEQHEPPPRVRERVMAAIAQPAGDLPPSDQPSSYTVTADAAWGDSGVPGISAKMLAIDRTRGVVTLLLRGEAGARYPAHHHSAAEECYVVRGSVAIGGLVLRAGDFHHADAASDHGEIVALESSEVLLFAAIADYLPA